MDIAIEEAQKALKKGLVPVGTVIVLNNEIISKSYNQDFWHAEILCIQKAQKKLGKFLEKTTIYSTLEPCPMCLYAIKLAKIKTIIFGTKNLNITKNKVEIINNIKQNDCSDLLKKFFKTKRNK